MEDNDLLEELGNLAASMSEPPEIEEIQPTIPIYIPTPIRPKPKTPQKSVNQTQTRPDTPRPGPSKLKSVSKAKPIPKSSGQSKNTKRSSSDKETVVPKKRQQQDREVLRPPPPCQLPPVPQPPSMVHENLQAPVAIPNMCPMLPVSLGKPQLMDLNDLLRAQQFTSEIKVHEFRREKNTENLPASHVLHSNPRKDHQVNINLRTLQTMKPGEMFTSSVAKVSSRECQSLLQEKPQDLPVLGFLGSEDEESYFVPPNYPKQTCKILISPQDEFDTEVCIKGSNSIQAKILSILHWLKTKNQEKKVLILGATKNFYTCKEGNWKTSPQEQLHATLKLLHFIHACQSYIMDLQIYLITPPPQVSESFTTVLNKLSNMIIGSIDLNDNLYGPKIEKRRIQVVHTIKMYETLKVNMQKLRDRTNGGDIKTTLLNNYKDGSFNKLNPITQYYLCDGIIRQILKQQKSPWTMTPGNQTDLLVKHVPIPIFDLHSLEIELNLSSEVSSFTALTNAFAPTSTKDLPHPHLDSSWQRTTPASKPSSSVPSQPAARSSGSINPHPSSFRGRPVFGRGSVVKKGTFRSKLNPYKFYK